MNVSEAAECIWEGYRRGEFFPTDLVGQLSFDEALRVQLDILERRLARGERLAGWKIGLTSATVRAHYGTDRQPFGHIVESGVIPSPGEVALDDLAVGCGVEPELCVTMGSDLRGPGVTAGDARAAVASMAPGMEINQKREGGVTDFELSVADNLTQWAILQGPASPVADEFDSDSLRVTVTDFELSVRCRATARCGPTSSDATSSTIISSPSPPWPTFSENTDGISKPGNGSSPARSASTTLRPARSGEPSSQGSAHARCAFDERRALVKNE